MPGWGPLLLQVSVAGCLSLGTGPIFPHELAASAVPGFVSCDYWMRRCFSSCGLLGIPAMPVPVAVTPLQRSAGALGTRQFLCPEHRVPPAGCRVLGAFLPCGLRALGKDRANGQVCDTAGLEPKCSGFFRKSLSFLLISVPSPEARTTVHTLGCASTVGTATLRDALGAAGLHIPRPPAEGPAAAAQPAAVLGVQDACPSLLQCRGCRMPAPAPCGRTTHSAAPAPRLPCS